MKLKKQLSIDFQELRKVAKIVHILYNSGVFLGAVFGSSGLIPKSPKVETFPSFHTVQLTNRSLILVKDQAECMWVHTVPSR